MNLIVYEINWNIRLRRRKQSILRMTPRDGNIFVLLYQNRVIPSIITHPFRVKIIQPLPDLDLILFPSKGTTES